MPRKKKEVQTVKMERDGRFVDAPLEDADNMIANGWVKVDDNNS